MLTNVIRLADDRLKLGVETQAVALHKRAQHMRLDFPDE